MKHFLDKIKSKEQLPEFFNAYIERLSAVWHLSSITHSSMRDFCDSKDVMELNKTHRYRGLLILEQSLHRLFENYTKAIAVINELENEYQFDSKYYATSKRMESIAKYGGEAVDYNLDGTVKFLEDANALKYCTIKHDLGQFIQLEESDGEMIGTSASKHFKVFNHLVRNATDLDPFKLLREYHKKEITVYKQDENGNMVPQTVLERIESEMSADTMNNLIVDVFEKAIDQGVKISDHLKSIDAFDNDPEKYRDLREMLVSVMNLSFKGIEASGC